MFDKHLTEDLLERLLKSDDVDSYLAQEQLEEYNLQNYLWQLLERQHMKRSALARESGINATVVYDIFTGKSRPGREHALMLAIGLNCDLRETQRLLRLAGANELWCKRRRDAIIIWCIDNGFDLNAVEDELRRLGEPTLRDDDDAAGDAFEADTKAMP